MKRINHIVFILLSLSIMFGVVEMKAQKKTFIKGKVISASDKSVLIGVSVIEKSKDNRVISGTMTNLDGEYLLNIKDTKNRIEFSYLGFNTTSFVIGSQQIINVSLQSKENLLSEAFVTAKRLTNDGALNIETREITGSVPVSYTHLTLPTI